MADIDKFNKKLASWKKAQASYEDCAKKGKPCTSKKKEAERKLAEAKAFGQEGVKKGTIPAPALVALTPSGKAAGTTRFRPSGASMPAPGSAEPAQDAQVIIEDTPSSGVGGTTVVLAVAGVAAAILGAKFLL